MPLSEWPVTKDHIIRDFMSKFVIKFFENL